MLLKKDDRKKRFWAIALVLVGGLLFCILYFNPSEKKDLPTDKHSSADLNNQSAALEKGLKTSPDGSVQGDIIVLPDIDYKNLKNDEALESLMASRKKKLGIKKSLDMIVKTQEEFQVGDNKISMADILKKAFVKKGAVYQEKITPSGEITPQETKEYGIYVVQPGDNIWNIHFNILKDYYDHQGISLSPKADEPTQKGLSSGVGKILKFSENLVIIYNLAEKRLTSNIDLIEPLSKIVVYNMDEVFSLLKEVSYDNIDRIQFDGKTIWIPAKKQ